MKIIPLADAFNLTAFVIEDVRGLDPVTVIMRDTEPGKGKLIIECYSRAWSCYWGGMMADHKPCTVGRFVISSVDAAYIVNCLVRGLGEVRLKSKEKVDDRYLARIVDAVRDALRVRLGLGAPAKVACADGGVLEGLNRTTTGVIGQP